MKDIELKLDRLVQQWATRQRSYVSCVPASCGHHFIGRANKLLRWDLLNIIPLTYHEHTLVHTGELKIVIKNAFRLQHLINMKNKNLKDYLLENNLTEDEWLKQQYSKLVKELEK